MTIATGHLAQLIEAYFSDGAKFGVNIDYFREPDPLGTVGALPLIDDLDEEAFLVMNGDILTDIDYGALLSRHRASGATTSTVAVTVRDDSRSRSASCASTRRERLAAGHGLHEKPMLEYDVDGHLLLLAGACSPHIEPGVRLDFPELCNG